MSLVSTGTNRVFRSNAQARGQWPAGAVVSPDTFGLSAWESVFSTTSHAPQPSPQDQQEEDDPSTSGVYALPFSVDDESPLVLCVDLGEALSLFAATILVDRFVLMTRLYSVCAEDAPATDGVRTPVHRQRETGSLAHLEPRLAQLKKMLAQPIQLVASAQGVDMVSVANEMRDVLKPVLVGVEVEVRCDAASLVIGGDIGMSRQLMLALLLNAFVRTRTGGGRRMVLKLDAVEPYVDLGVWDEGQPMTDEEFADFFEDDISGSGSWPRTSLDHARSLALGMGGDISLGSHEQRPSMNEVRVSFPALRQRPAHE